MNRNSNNKKTAAEIVYDYILNGLIKREYAPGMSLREEKFSEECNCSATPVREAFRRLEKDGWIVNQPYCGCSVKVFNIAEATELFALRETIESRAVLSIINQKITDFSSMEKAISDMEKCLACEEIDAAHTLQSDLAFHRAIIELAQLPKLAFYMSNVDLQLRTFIVVANWVLYKQEVEDILEQHRMILWAMRHGWHNAAEGLIKDHLSQGKNLTINIMQQNQVHGAKKGVCSFFCK